MRGFGVFWLRLFAGSARPRHRGTKVERGAARGGTPSVRPWSRWRPWGRGSWRCLTARVASTSVGLWYLSCDKCSQLPGVINSSSDKREQRTDWWGQDNRAARSPSPGSRRTSSPTWLRVSRVRLPSDDLQSLSLDYGAPPVYSSGNPSAPAYPPVGMEIFLPLKIFLKYFSIKNN